VHKTSLLQEFPQQACVLFVPPIYTPTSATRLGTAGVQAWADGSVHARVPRRQVTKDGSAHADAQVARLLGSRPVKRDVLYRFPRGMWPVQLALLPADGNHLIAGFHQFGTR